MTIGQRIDAVAEAMTAKEWERFNAVLEAALTALVPQPTGPAPPQSEAERRTSCDVLGPEWMAQGLGDSRGLPWQQDRADMSWANPFDRLHQGQTFRNWSPPEKTGGGS